MSVIKWISTTSKSFHDPSAWSGGTVPGVNDTVSFTSEYTGMCTCHADVEIGGLGISSDFPASAFIPGENRVVVYGDIEVASKINFSGAQLELTGVSDQNVTFPQDMDHAVFLIVNKYSGRLTIGNGTFSLAGDCHINGTLSFSSSFTGSFQTNGYGVSIAGFSIPLPITGTIKFGTSTISNSGPVDFRGVPLSGVITADKAKWIQSGGTASTPNAWRDGGGVRTGLFDLIQFVEGSYTVMDYTNHWFATPQSLVDILGNVQFKAGTQFLFGRVNIGQNASLTGGDINLYATALTGNTRAIHLTRLRARDNFNLPVNGDYDIPVDLMSNVGTSSITGVVGDGSIFRKRLSLYVESSSTFNVKLNNVTCMADVVTSRTPTATLNIIGNITLAGTNDQFIDFSFSRTDHLFFRLNKPRGQYRISGGMVKLYGESWIHYLDCEAFPDGFSLNGSSLNITGTQLHLIEIDSDKYVLNGKLAFHGQDFLMRNTVLPHDSVLSFVNACDARFISLDEAACSPGTIQVEETGTLQIRHRNSHGIDGQALSRIVLSGDLTVKGTLKCPDVGETRLIFSGSHATCEIGHLAASPNAVLILEPQCNAVKPNHLKVEGRVELEWNVPVSEINLLPGDYREFKEILVPENVETIRFSPGRYEFSRIAIATSADHETKFFSSSQEEIRISGEYAVKGSGTCSSMIEQFVLDTLVLGCPFEYNGDFVRIDHPLVYDRGFISCTNKLVIRGTTPCEIDDGNVIDVQELCVCDADGSMTVPHYGYESLTLTAAEQDSVFPLRGEYRMKNFTLTANRYRLLVDVNEFPVMQCSGNMVSRTENNGCVEIRGDGSDTWVLNGSERQTVDLSFVHGRHVMGTLVDSNTAAGDDHIVLASPLAVIYYTNTAGMPLEPCENLTILSSIFLESQLALVVEGQPEPFVATGIRLENGKIFSGGTAGFYAEIMDQKQTPLDTGLVETIILDVKMMNPIAPYLHKERKNLVSGKELVVGNVLKPSLREEGHRLPENFHFNFHFDNGISGIIHFDEPGLYYVLFGIKLFGHKKAIPLRYELFCERPI